MIFCPYQQVMRPQSRSALSSLSSLRENRRKALIAKIMTRFELQYGHITGFIYFKTCSHGKSLTITEGSGGSGWALNRRGNPWSQARIPGSWLVKILAELWLAEISMTQHIFCESDFWLEDPGARFPKPNIYSNYTKYYFSNRFVYTTDGLNR